MKEIVGDLWKIQHKYDAIVITTNGIVKSNGQAVMGRGVALEAAQKYPQLASWLGYMINEYGNHVHVTSFSQWNGESDYEDLLITFPTKYHWKGMSKISLIKRSAEELVGVIDTLGYTKNVLLPRPGCGNGGLLWKDVKPVLEPILDDRFTTISKE